MFLADALAVVHTIVAIGRVINCICQDAAPIAADVAKVVQLGLQVNALRSTYISNKHACCAMVETVKLLNADLEALDKQYSTSSSSSLSRPTQPPAHLKGRIDAVQSLLHSARALLLDNIMPDAVANSSLKRSWWIAKRVACTNQVVASFKKMNEQLLQQMAGLGVSVNVAVSSRLQQSFNHSEQLSEEVGELRRYITQ